MGSRQCNGDAARNNDQGVRIAVHMADGMVSRSRSKSVRSLADISVFPKNWRLQVADVPIGRSSLHYRSVAPDDTVKYLLKLTDGEIVETVGIPSDKRLTVCVSTQVGCPIFIGSNKFHEFAASTGWQWVVSRWWKCGLCFTKKPCPVRP